jgi:HEAT repeat protein
MEPLLTAMKDDKESLVRSTAAYALGQLGDRRAVGPLIEAMTDEKDRSVQIEAAAALGKIKDFKAVEPLIQSIDNHAIVDNVKNSLKAITGQSFQTLSEWEKWWNENKVKMLTLEKQ